MTIVDGIGFGAFFDSTPKLAVRASTGAPMPRGLCSSRRTAPGQATRRQLAARSVLP